MRFLRPSVIFKPCSPSLDEYGSVQITRIPIPTLSAEKFHSAGER